MALQLALAQILEPEMIRILDQYDQEAKVLCNKNSIANWNVQTDVLNTSLVVEQVRWEKVYN